MRVVGRVRARTYFDLGLNIARLLSLVSGVAVVRAAAQLLAEFDYYCSKDGSIQDLVRVGTLGVCEGNITCACVGRCGVQKLMVSRAKSGYYPDTLTDVPDSEPVRPVLHKHNGRIVYEYLTVLAVVCVCVCASALGRLLKCCTPHCTLPCCCDSAGPGALGLL
jgi:hypothetical protein